MTVVNPPREHHFVTQSWIRRFEDADGKLHAYDREKGNLKARSSKNVMKITDLYTLDPEGIDDTSIESVDLQKVDDEGAKVMTAVLSGELSEETRRSLAEFLAVQIMRDPQRMFDYSRTAQRFLSRLFIEIFSTQSFEELQMFFGDFVLRSEYEHVLSLGDKQAALEVARIQLALEARGGVVQLPFTDLIRAPDGREKLRDSLLGLNWTLITAPLHSFVLGDQGVLFDPGQLGTGLRVPLSSGAALILSAVEGSNPHGICSRPARHYEPSSMNYESAARSRRWVVGAKQAVEEVVSQITGDPLPKR